MSEALRGIFRQFGRGECTTSPLYARLCEGIALDPDLLALAGEAARTPVPNLLFGAVQFLLRRSDHPLRRFYASAPGDPGPLFREFCLDRRDDIVALLKTKIVQTNEVRRAAILRPAFTSIDGPYFLVEVGPSAGLLLAWDRYSYIYGDAPPLGPPDAPLTIRCGVHGAPPPEGRMPDIRGRVGIDLNPIDDEDGREWLRALVWPENRDRAEQLDRALATVAAAPPPMIRGDVLQRLPGVLADLEPGLPVVVFHAAVFNVFSPGQRDAFRAILRDASGTRRVHHLSLESQLLDLDDRRLASSGIHGSWIEWNVSR